MTAFNMLTFPDGVALISDTATYPAAGGKIASFAGKSYVNEDRRWGALFTGSVDAAQFIRGFFEATPSMNFDVVEAMIPAMLSDCRAALFPHVGENCELSIALAGWSQTRGEWCGAVASTDGAIGGREAFTAHPVGAVTQPKCEIGGEVRGLNQAELEVCAARLGIREFARRLLCAQRRSGTHEGRPVIIGGTGELVIITAKGVTRETVARWFDGTGDTAEKLRERAAAEPFDELLTDAPPASRAERRRAARTARRAA